MLHGKLRVCPALPDSWHKLDFAIFWHGQRLHMVIDRNTLTITNETGTRAVEVEVYGQNYQIRDSIHVQYAEL